MTTVAVVHPTGLLGQELRSRLAALDLGLGEVRLLSSLDEEIGTVTEVAGAAAFVQRLDEGSAEGVDLAFLCGPAADARSAVALLPDDAIKIVLSNDASVEDGAPLVAGVNLTPVPPPGPLLSPHPVVVMLARLLAPLRGLGVESAVATIVEPVSALGGEALDELFAQALAVVGMQPRPSSDRFGRQAVFNLYPVPPDGVLAGLLQAVLPSPPAVVVQLLRGGVFHGYAASVFVRFARPPAVERLRRSLRQTARLARRRELPGPVEIAGKDDLVVGAIEPDGDGVWLWAVMDNLTCGGVLNALSIARAAMEEASASPS